jgi:hypothetical protein
VRRTASMSIDSVDSDMGSTLSGGVTFENE